MLRISPAGLKSFLKSRPNYYDLIFVSRPNNLKSLVSAIAGLSPAVARVPILYDAEAIWAKREVLRRTVEGIPPPVAEQRRLLEEEVSLGRIASHVTAVNMLEAAEFLSGGCNSVSVLSYGVQPLPGSSSYRQRRDILFVGSLDDDESPNTDAVIWFANDILPRVRRLVREPFRLIIAGRSAAPRVRALAGPDIILLGKVPDLIAVYEAARVFIAPHRYAGGIPTKVLDASAHGVPCVTTELLAKQLNWNNCSEILSAATAEGFAQATSRLYQDEATWGAVRECALQAMDRDYNKDAFAKALSRAIETATEARPIEVRTSDRRSFVRRGLSNSYWRMRWWIGGKRQVIGATARLFWQAARVAMCPLFDAEWYLMMNPDVAKQRVNPALHYVEHGAAEGRDPGPAFSTIEYLWRYPDVKSSGINPLLHYLKFGKREGRIAVAGPPRQADRKVLCAAGEPGGPGLRCRVVDLVAAFNDAGVSATWMTLDELARNSGTVCNCDLLVLWRVAWSDEVKTLTRLARSAGATILFDVDDLTIEPRLACERIIDGIRTQGLHEAEVKTYFERTLMTFEKADWASCSTQELAAAMRLRGKPVFVIPNGFTESNRQRSRLAVRRRRLIPNDGFIRIGYAAGTPTHQHDFAQAAGAIGVLLREMPECRLVLFQCLKTGKPFVNPAEFPALRGLDSQIEWRNAVAHERLPDELARFDINIAPIEMDNSFCEAKSELKFVEAALVEVCTVASPTGPFRRAIRNGETGFLAENSETWISALSRLTKDPSLRKRIGRAAYRDVLWTYGPGRRSEIAALMLDQMRGDARSAARSFSLETSRKSGPQEIALPRPVSDVVFETDNLGSAQATIAIPLHNYSGYISEALDSVAAQSAKVLDLIIVDDASTDASLTAAEAWLRSNASRFNRTILLRNRVNAGLGPTRNACFDAAETPFVLPLDPDNRLLPEACEELIASMRDDAAAFVYPLIRQFDGGIDIMGKASYTPQAFIGGNTIDAMAMIRKECWAAAGGYARMQPQGWEDFDFWCRLIELGFWGRRLPKILAEYRLHSRSMQNSPDHIRRDLIRVMQQRHPWLSLVE